MNSILKTDSKFDEKFEEIKLIIENAPVPNDIDFVYDVAKRLLNSYGIGIQFILSIYTLGILQGIQEEKKEEMTSIELKLNNDFENILVNLSDNSLLRLQAFGKGLLKSEENQKGISEVI